MTRIPGGLLLAALLFGVGLATGQLMPSLNVPDVPRPPEPVESEPGPARPILPVFLLDEFDSPVVHASFETTGEVPQILRNQHVSAEIIEATILRYFPDLSADALKGWVDSYRELPVAELEALLLQKREMPTLFPDRSFLADHLFELLPVDGAKTNDSTSLIQIRRVQDNISHWTTCGFRRSDIRSGLISGQPAGPSSAITFDGAARSFTPGELRESDSPLHMAIDGQRHLMFRLSPGFILTRRGMFERLDDGTMGLRFEDGSIRRLYGDIKVPPAYRKISVAAGKLSVLGSDGLAIVSELELARVDDLSLLQTENGVFFSISESSEHRIEMVPAERVVTHSLENSNVVLEDERVLLQHLERIAEFSIVP